MTENDHPMPSEECLNFSIASAVETADRMQVAIAYPFELADVERVYTLAYYDGGGGDGIWFRLRNGAVFDIMGNRVSRRKGSFERPVRGFDALSTAAYVMDRLHGRQPSNDSASYGVPS